jgi:hypothetical protein
MFTRGLVFEAHDFLFLNLKSPEISLGFFFAGLCFPAAPRQTSRPRPNGAPASTPILQNP